MHAQTLPFCLHLPPIQIRPSTRQEEKGSGQILQTSNQRIVKPVKISFFGPLRIPLSHSTTKPLGKMSTGVGDLEALWLETMAHEESAEVTLMLQIQACVKVQILLQSSVKTLLLCFGHDRLNYCAIVYFWVGQGKILRVILGT